MAIRAGRTAAPVDPPAAITAPAGQINTYLDEFVGSVGLPTNLAQAIRYSLLGPGKRLRPLLSWHCFAAVAGPNGDPADSLPAGGAVELVHAFSLVHDDLPGLDNDDLRRGRPTLHKHAGEAMAILAGDAMLNLAFQLITARTPPTHAAALSRELAEATSGMIAGQVYDTLGGFDPHLSDADRLRLIHHSKTGMLIRAACRMGALLALDSSAASEPSLAAITTYAEDIGLMFQIVDDLLDVTQTTEHLGKKAGKDQDAGKLTYPGVFGIDTSRRQVRELHENALKSLAPFGPAADPLRQLADYLAVRTR